MIGGEVEGWVPEVGVRHVKRVSSEIGFLRNLPIVPSKFEWLPKKNFNF
jgi:hypothetical protein